MEPKPERNIDGWRLVELLGSGANAEVWRAERDSHQVALKVMHKARGDRWQRFADEIAVMRRFSDHPGVLPLLDAHLPKTAKARARGWLATPIARRAAVALGPEPALTLVVRAVRQWALTLADLAEHGVGHRDLKPDNLFFHNGLWVVGDFGLATYPEKEAVTAPDRKLGPLYFLAPEMLRSPDEAKAEPADVYSLAKTLWVFATGQRYPPEGQVRVELLQNRLGRWINAEGSAPLDLLIERATDADAHARPRMREFADELGAWSSPPIRPSREPATLGDLARRIDAVSRPGLREQELRLRRGAQVEELWRRLDGLLEPVQRDLEALFPVVARHGNPPLFERLAQQTTSILEQRTAAVYGTNADLSPVVLYAIVGLQWIDADRARLAASLYLEDPYAGDLMLWSDQFEVLLGSAREQRTVEQLAAELSGRTVEAGARAAARMELREESGRYRCWGRQGPDVGQFEGPWGIACSTADAGCYVIDSGNNRVQSFGPGGAPREWVGTRSAEELDYGKLDFPSGACVDHEGYVWVADHGHARLVRFDRHGGPVEGFGTQPPGTEVLQGPADVASAPDGTVFVVDRLRDCVVTFSGPTGGARKEWGGQGRAPGELRVPCGIAVRHGRFVYVADSGNDRLQKFTAAGELVDVWDASRSYTFRAPHGVALDADENVYVADSENHRILMLSSDGELLLSWGRHGREQGQFIQPRGVAVDGAGDVYVVEYGGTRVQRFSQQWLARL